jgi:hypothetical protein
VLKWYKDLVVSLFLCTFATEIRNSSEDNLKSIQVMTKSNDKINKVLAKVCKDLGIKIDVSEYDDDEHVTIFFSFYTDCGQDVCKEINLYDWNDVDEIRDKLAELYENFDVDYETYIWLGDDGHGKSGAPYHIKDVLADMEEVDEKLKQLSNEFEKAIKC